MKKEVCTGLTDRRKDKHKRSTQALKTLSKLHLTVGLAGPLLESLVTSK